MQAGREVGFSQIFFPGKRADGDGPKTEARQHDGAERDSDMGEEPKNPFRVLSGLWEGFCGVSTLCCPSALAPASSSDPSPLLPFLLFLCQIRLHVSGWPQPPLPRRPERTPPLSISTWRRSTRRSCSTCSRTTSGRRSSTFPLPRIHFRRGVQQTPRLTRYAFWVRWSNREFKDARVGSLKELWEALGQYTHGASEGRTEEDWEAFKLLYGCVPSLTLRASFACGCLSGMDVLPIHRETVKSLDLPEPPSMVASGSCNTPSIPKIVVPTDSSSSLTPLPSGGQSSSSQPSGNQQPSALPTSIVLPPASPPHSPSHPDIPVDMTTLTEGSTFFPPSPPPDDIFPSRDAQHLLLPLVTPFARSLYPLPPLPADARRPVLKGASSKAGSVSSKKGRVQAPVQEGVDLTRWFAQVQANPVSKLMGTARKCLGSDDWATAHQELRFLRAMGRIEELKLEGRWSFRQPKKQKGPPVGKSSWDWLLEEMVRPSRLFFSRLDQLD